MIAADTNVLVRALVGDDASQSAVARRWLQRHERDGVYVDHIVLVELAWVLRARYLQTRGAIALALSRLLETSGLVVPQRELVRRAVEAFRNGPGDFADHLLRERAAAADASPLATFDKELHDLRGFAKLR